MNFGTFGSGFGSFGSSVGNLLPPQSAPTNSRTLADWVRVPTTDGKTVTNQNGTDAVVKTINCLEFDGTNDHIDLTNVIANGSSFEIEARVKCIANLPTDGTDTTHIFYQGTYGSSSGLIQCSLRGGSTYKGMLFRIGNGSGAYNELKPDSDQTSTINDNDWHTYKYTFDGNDTMKLFLDGSEVGSKTSLTSPTFSSTSVNAIMNSASSEYGVNCKISDHITTVAGSVFRQLPLAEGSGTVAYDVTGNGGNGTIDGASWVTEDSISSWNLLNGFTNNDVLTTFDSYNSAQSTLADVNVDDNFKNWKRLTKTGSGSQYIYFRKSVGAASSAASQTSRIYFKRGNWDYLGFKNQDTAGSNHHTINTSTLAITNQGTGYISSTAYDIGDGIIEWTITSTTASGGTGFAGIALTNSSGVENHSSVSTGAYVDILADCFKPTLAKIPLLENNTLQVMNFDGVNDKLVATGIASSDTITHDGTATLTAATGEITSNAGTAYNIKVNGVLTFTGQSGVGTTTIPSENGSIGDATATNVSLDSFWGKRVVDSSGSIVPASYYNGTLYDRNPSGFVHNNCEVAFDTVTDNDVTAAEILAIDNSSATQYFAKRRSSLGVTEELTQELLIYSGAIDASDAELARVRNYVG